MSTSGIWFHGMLQLPYEIGNFIADQVPYLDERCIEGIGTGQPRASHKAYFKSGPNPFTQQMRKGILLETGQNCIPEKLYTRFGAWTVLSPCGNNFYQIFQIVKKELNLIPFSQNDADDVHTTLWTVQTWKGNKLDKPVRANLEEYVGYDVAMEAYNRFIRATQSRSRL